MNIKNILGNRNNVTIVTKRITNNSDCSTDTTKKFDETKTISTDGIKKIYIDSDNINIRVTQSNTNDVVAHLYGSTTQNAEIKLCVSKFEDEIHISVESETDQAESNTIIINSNRNFFVAGTTNIISQKTTVITNGNVLDLDVQIPSKKFDELYTQSKNGPINIDNQINIDNITLDNKNGTINVCAIFKRLNIDCKNSTVNVNSTAHSDINLNISSKNGTINVTIKNLAVSKVSVSTKNGTTVNNPNLSGIYTASGEISCKNGTAVFH